MNAYTGPGTDWRSRLNVLKLSQPPRELLNSPRQIISKYRSLSPGAGGQTVKAGAASPRPRRAIVVSTFRFCRAAAFHCSRCQFRASVW